MAGLGGPREPTVSDRIEYNDNTKYIEKFLKDYTKMFNELRGKIMIEYKVANRAYVKEFNKNHQANIIAKKKNISNFINQKLKNIRNQGAN